MKSYTCQLFFSSFLLKHTLRIAGLTYISKKLKRSIFERLFSYLSIVHVRVGDSLNIQAITNSYSLKVLCISQNKTKQNKKKLIEVPKSFFCLFVQQTPVLRSSVLHYFPTALAEMLLTSENCFPACMLREEAILDVYFMLEGSIHKRKGKILLQNSVCDTNHPSVHSCDPLL